MKMQGNDILHIPSEIVNLLQLVPRLQSRDMSLVDQLITQQWKSNVNKHEEGSSLFSLLSLVFLFQSLTSLENLSQSDLNLLLVNIS